jgi:hypothetical protein
MMNEYERYLDTQANFSKIKERLNVDDIVYVQNEQHIYKAQVVKISEKSAKLKLLEGSATEEVKNFPYVKIVKENDSVALVWEAWRGAGGRGGYRWEREAYENLRIPVENIPKKAFVCEEKFKVVSKIYENSYLEKICPTNKTKKASLK